MAGSAEFSYRVFWIRTARDWSSEKRAAARAAVLDLTTRETFVPTLFERSYRLEAVDASSHSGVSLLALQAVLEALPPEPLGDDDDDEGYGR